MIERIDANFLHGITEHQSRKVEPKMSAQNSSNIDVLSQITCKSLLDAAKQLPSEDAQAVADAKALLLSGSLDSPANICQAAENMLKFGV